MRGVAEVLNCQEPRHSEPLALTTGIMDLFDRNFKDETIIPLHPVIIEKSNLVVQQEPTC
jgi:hypothetical protein